MNKLTIKDAAKLMGKSEQFLRIGLQQGVFPFGNAVKMSSKWTYFIAPEAFYNYIGVTVEELKGN